MCRFTVQGTFARNDGKSKKIGVIFRQAEIGYFMYLFLLKIMSLVCWKTQIFAL